MRTVNWAWLRGIGLKRMKMLGLIGTGIWIYFLHK